MFTWIKGLMLSTILALGVLAVGAATTTEDAKADRWYRGGYYGGGYYGSYYRPYYRPSYSYYRPYYNNYYRPYYNDGYRRGGIAAGPVRVWW